MRWTLELSSDESPERRRMTLFHELKHVIDDPADKAIYRGLKRREKVADYFAAQVLIPKPWLKYDLGGGDHRSVGVGWPLPGFESGHGCPA
ncbi:MAG: ImmA/IrrE family metallo-endopeptidase [Solirubrobacterales bacterium]|nr:ImmA/IrrE family metallo-endopeptidase [Solirubrobacterales bacterium]